MGLEKYTPYKSCNDDQGREISTTLSGAFSPDFFNTNTIQLWDVSATAEAEIIKWIGTTLADNSVHEITIVNNANSAITTNSPGSLTAIRNAINFRWYATN